MSVGMEERLEEIARIIASQAEREKITIASAESCTGGLIASTLTSVPGASKWFDTGIVSYTYGSKHNVLGIDSALLDGGLVTSATAESMARRVAVLSGVDYAVSTTGVSGPEGAEGHDPCFAYVGVYTPSGVRSFPVQNEDAGRRLNTQWIALQALRLLSEAIRSERGGE